MLLIAAVITLSLASCTDDDDNGCTGAVSPVSAVDCTPFIGSVIVSWQQPADEAFYYTLITYTDSEGRTVNKKVSRFAAGDDGMARTIITGFTDENQHTFTLTAFASDGSHSEPVSASCTPQAASGAAQYVLDSVTFTSTIDGARMDWVNETEIPVAIFVEYTNAAGMYIDDDFDATESGSHTFTDLGFSDTEFTVYAEIDDASDNPARSTTATHTCAPAVDPRDIISIWYDPNRTQPVNFDFGCVGMTIEKTGEDQYRLVMDTSAPERYFIVEPLGTALRRTDIALTFDYKSTDNCALTLLYYPFDWGTIGQNYHNVGELWKATDWTTATFDLESKITSLPVKWGEPNSQFRMQFTNDGMLQVGEPLTFEIRNIKLRPAVR